MGPFVVEAGDEIIESIGILGGLKRVTGDEIAAGKVADGQRVAIASVGQHELALVVRAPQLVGLTGRRQRCPPAIR